MNEKLLSRLDELAAVAAGVRAKIAGDGAGQLDGLAVAAPPPDGRKRKK